MEDCVEDVCFAVQNVVKDGGNKTNTKYLHAASRM